MSQENTFKDLLMKREKAFHRLLTSYSSGLLQTFYCPDDNGIDTHAVDGVAKLLAAAIRKASIRDKKETLAIISKAVEDMEEKIDQVRHADDGSVFTSDELLNDSLSHITNATKDITDADNFHCICGECGKEEE